jgi:hypothetical protein
MFPPDFGLLDWVSEKGHPNGSLPAPASLSNGGGFWWYAQTGLGWILDLGTVFRKRDLPSDWSQPGPTWIKDRAAIAIAVQLPPLVVL